MPSNRRSFLLGRRTETGTFERFNHALARAVRGRVAPGVTQPGATTVLFAADSGDIVAARALCARFGIKLALQRQPEEGASDSRLSAAVSADSDESLPLRSPELRVNLDQLDTIKPVSDARDPQALWRVAPGARLGDLCAAGLPQFAGWPPAMWLASWMSRPHPVLAPGHCGDSGLVGAEVLLADGTIETLGPFGASGTRPLKSPRIQALVPALFQLAQQTDAVLLRQQPVWLARGRLDALTPAHPEDVNLAQLFLGNQGRYGWALQSLLRAAPTPSADLPDAGEVPEALLAAAARLNSGLQAVLDQAGLFED